MMHQKLSRTLRDIEARLDAVGTGGDIAGQLEKLTSLHEKGALTEQQFEVAKAKVLGMTID